MDIDERLERIAQKEKALHASVEKLTRDVRELSAAVAKRELWEAKVRRSVDAGVEAALREWRNGENPIDNPTGS